MDEITKGGACRIDNDDVAKVIAEITRAAEDASGALSAMIATGTRWEKWWQGTIVVGLTLDPWGRKPGRPEQSAATLQIEQNLKPRKGTAYARAGKRTKQVDVVVTRDPDSEQAEHLIELKLVPLGETRAKREAQMKSIRDTDIPALISVTGGVDFGSAWAVALAYSADGRKADKRTFVSLTRDGRWPPVLHPIKLRRSEFTAYVVGVRVA